MFVAGALKATLGLDWNPFRRAAAQAQVAGNTLERGLNAGFARVGGAFRLHVVAAFAALPAAALVASTQIEKAFRTIRAGTGATGDSLRGLQRDFQAVLAASNDSIDEVAKTIAKLNTRVGLEGAPLRELANVFLDIDEVTGESGVALIAPATRAFHLWNVAASDMAGKLDMIFRASQQTDIGMGQLLAQLTQHGPVLQSLGLEIEDAIAMLGLFEREGVDASAVLSAMRMGFAKLLGSGDTDIAGHFRKVIASVREARTTFEAMEIISKNFGTRGMVPLSSAIRGGRFEFEQLRASLESGTDTINGVATATQTWGDILANIKNRFAAAMTAWQPWMDAIKAGVLGFGTAMANVMGQSAGFFETDERGARRSANLTRLEQRRHALMDQARRASEEVIRATDTAISDLEDKLTGSAIDDGLGDIVLEFEALADAGEALWKSFYPAEGVIDKAVDGLQQLHALQTRLNQTSNANVLDPSTLARFGASLAAGLGDATQETIADVTRGLEALGDVGHHVADGLNAAIIAANEAAMMGTSALAELGDIPQDPIEAHIELLLDNADAAAQAAGQMAALQGAVANLGPEYSGAAKALRVAQFALRALDLGMRISAKVAEITATAFRWSWESALGVFGLILEAIYLIIDAMGFLGGEQEKTARGMEAVWEEVTESIDGWIDQLADKLVEFIRTGEASFKEFVDTVLDELAKIAITNLVLDPIVRFVGNQIGFAKGGVFDQKGIIPFAKGGHVTRGPEAFRIGIRGEAGPEAVLPLERMPNGDLGVQARDNSNAVVVNIIDKRAAGAPPIGVVERISNGARELQIVIEDVVDAALARGRFDRSMSVLGAARRPI